ncbi:MAG: hypothetical protein SOR38_09385 [Oscillospiraceae bacterium]|nr:hypothetical protein [Oscillospiraceae bacterium]
MSIDRLRRTLRRIYIVRTVQRHGARRVIAGFSCARCGQSVS